MDLYQKHEKRDLTVLVNARDQRCSHDNIIQTDMLDTQSREKEVLKCRVISLYHWCACNNNSITER